VKLYTYRFRFGARVAGCPIDALEKVEVEVDDEALKVEVDDVIPSKKRNEMTPSRRIKIRVGFIRGTGYRYGCKYDGRRTDRHSLRSENQTQTTDIHPLQSLAVHFYSILLYLSSFN
jgi:hypothetical protein